MKILFIGDIVGRLGRTTVKHLLPKIKKKQKIDLVIANAENSAHGSGVTDIIINELLDAGIDWMTTGDHAFGNKKQTNIFETKPILRPANFPPKNPGRGYTLFEKNKKKIAIINLIGRVYMKMDYDCPFRKLDEILANISLQEKKLSAIILDIHAEATAEKINMAYYANGRISAVIGTHTHVMTADAKILNKGTAFISDVGMTGAADESLGIAKEGTLRTFLTQTSETHVLPEKGRGMLNAVLLTIDSAKAKSIKPIIEYINIK